MAIVSPCRLAVFLARRAPVGVVLRRGPSAWAQLVEWDRRTDQFTPGQWFHGRVYERRCDLSPDGRLFAYFAAKYQSHRRTDGSIGEAWTAISRPPYFTALTLWPNLGSWYGGGMFRDDRTLVLDATCSAEPHPDFRPQRLKIERMAPGSAPWEQRLLRDGWQLAERGFDPRTHRRIGKREIWEKSQPRLAVTLCREVEDVDWKAQGGIYRDTYWLETAGDLIPLTGATWADWDGDRLVFAERGKVLAADVSGGTAPATELFDFNELAPTRIATPGWARRW